MIEKIKVLQDIMQMFIKEPPLFLLTAIKSFVSIFLLALILLFCILLLQISKNLVFKKGKHLFSQGLCCIGISIVLSIVFTPLPVTIAAEDGIKRIEAVQFAGKEKMNSRYTFIYENQKIAQIMQNSTQTLNVMPTIKAKTGEVNYMLKIVYNSGKEEEINVNKHSTYYESLPKSGTVRRYVKGGDELYNLLNNLNGVVI